MCPRWIQSARGYKLSLRKNTEDMPLKVGEEAQQMGETALQVITRGRELTDSVTHSAHLSPSRNGCLLVRSGDDPPLRRRPTR